MDREQIVNASDVYLAKAAPETIEQHLANRITATVGTPNADGAITRFLGPPLDADL